MLRSMFSGVSGMRSYQTKMDVIGNNIANVGTTAFKAGRVQFQDLLSESMGAGQAPMEAGLGGTNPMQVGLGVSVGRIDTIMTEGALQPTGRALDLALEGQGFFVVSDRQVDADVELTDNAIRFTRDGSFVRDSEGNLTMGNGFRVVGFSYLDDGAIDGNTPDITDSPEEILAGEETEHSRTNIMIPNTVEDGGDLYDLESFSIDGTGLIRARYGNGDTYYVGRIEVVRFTNPDGMEKLGGNTYRPSPNSGEALEGIGGQGGYGIIRSGFMEMSNVDLANEFTEMIITSRSYQANSRTITTSDEMLQELLNLKR